MQSAKKVGGVLKDKLNFKFKKTFTLGFFVLAFFIFGLGFGKDASAATYYVDSSIVDTNIGSATPDCLTYNPSTFSCGSGSESIYVTLADLNTKTFSAGDSILLRKAQTWVGAWTVLGSGTAENAIVVSTFGSGANPIIDADNANTRAVGFGGNDYIIFDGLDMRNGTSFNFGVSGITDGIHIIDCSFSGGVTSVYFQAGDSILIDENLFSQPTSNVIRFTNNGTNYVNNSTISNNSFIGQSGYTFATGISITYSTNVTFSENTITDWSMGAGGKVLYLINVTGASISNNIIGTFGHGNGGHGIYVDTSTEINILNNTCEYANSAYSGIYYINSTGTITSNTSSNNGKNGFVMDSSAVTFNGNNIADSNGYAGYIFQGSSNITSHNSVASNSLGFSGFTITDSTVAELNEDISHDNFEDGFNSAGTAHVIGKKLLSYHNGRNNLSSTSAGDGYTSHYDSIFDLSYSIGYGNNKSGFAATQTSSGLLYNNIFYDNFESTLGSNWDETGDIGIGVDASGVWVIKNNITMGHPIEMMIDASAVSNGVDVSSDYNVFHDSLGGTAFDYNGGFYNFLNYKTASSSLDLNSKNENPLFMNSASNNFNLQSASPAIDSGTSVNLTSDYAGNPIYGTPDIGAYEYQPPHTIGTDKIDIAAGARIYGDGKFRDLSTTNSELADLTITPQSESFETYDSDEVRPEWLNITDITWDNNKEWTESSVDSSLTNTLHEVGDLTPNKYYNISVDNVLGQNITGTNCTAGICKADSNGKIAFTYTGTYSEHTFKVESGDNANPTLTNNTNNKFSTNTTSVNLSLTTDENSTCHYSNNLTTYDNSTPFTTTGETSHSSQLSNLTIGEYTYYAICRDSNNNESTYTLTFEIAPQEAKESLSTPIIKTSEGKEKMKSGSTIRSDNKEIKLQGEDIKLANGTIKIYRNSKHIKTTQADDKGKWSKKIELSKDFSGYIKIKQYDQYGTLINEKKTKVKVDNQKPIFETFIKYMTPVTAGKTNLTFLATDNNEIDEYRIYLGGKIYKSKKNSFTIPAKTDKGLQYLRVKAYDKAGNATYRETFVLVR